MEQCDYIKEESLSDDEPVKRPKSRRLKIHALTWNTNGKPPPVNKISQLFIYTADIQVISLQELGSHDWTVALDPCFTTEGLVRIKTRKLQGIMIIVYAQRNLLDYITHIESESTKTGMGGMWGNKGAVSVRFDIYGINIIFVNSHLAAHAEQLAHRIQDVSDIIDDQTFRDEEVNCILDHDYVVWMGDMNFRLDMSYEEALAMIRKNNIAGLLEHDQLKTVMKEGLIFEGFKEAPIHFRPTYKFDVGTDIYDTSQKKRVPSYTDRILYFFHKVTYGKKNHLDAHVTSYLSHPTFKDSDHKPVSCTMDIYGISKPSVNPITFKINKSISKKNPMNISYTSRNMELTTSDWIGLYPIDFNRLLLDYTAYQYATVNQSQHPYNGRVQFPAGTFSSLRIGDSFVLCYISKKYSFSGMSKPFKIKE